MKIIPTKDKHEFFMRTVYEVAKLSKDPRTKIGSVLVKNDNIISVGYNNFPSKVLDLEERYYTKELKYQFIVHSELNSILNAAKKGISTDNSTLYTQGVPCSNCAKHIIQSGVTKIIVHKQWPNLTYSPDWVKSFEYSNLMLEEASISLECYDKILSVYGYLDGKEIII